MGLPVRYKLANAALMGNAAPICYLPYLDQQISPLQQQLDVIHSKAAAQIYAALSPDQQTKVGNAIGMLMGGGFGPGMRQGGPPKQ